MRMTSGVHSGESGPEPRRAELARFLRAMRARVTPEEVGLPCHGTRRTPGLRRQEVAQLAAVSIDWYIRVEQGRAGTPSAAVLDAIAEALRLSPAEREHLHLLARDEQPRPGLPAHAPLPSSLMYLLHGMPLIPAYVVDFRFDIQAHNDGAAALFGEDFGVGERRNGAAVLFEHAPTRASMLDWPRIARETVGNLRANYARHREDEGLRSLIERLRGADEDFARWWEDRTVEERAHGVKRIRQPEAGDVTLYYDYLTVSGRSDLRLVTLTPADAASEQGVRTLIAQRTRRLSAEGIRTIAA
jgi:transcriptional regulator with XRE-family HTH domain